MTALLSSSDIVYSLFLRYTYSGCVIEDARASICALSSQTQSFLLMNLPDGGPSHQFTAFFMSAPILASSAELNSFSAKAIGHMCPSSRFASLLKPSVMYLSLNFCPLRKKQMTLPSLA